MLLNFIKKNKLLMLVIFFAFIFHFFISFPSGSYYCFNNQCGLYFWGAHEHDGIWHLAIIENAFKTWPPQHPIYAGEKLVGYNYFLDLIIFLLTKTGIPSIIWYFKILPLLWIVLMVFLIIKISQKLKKDYFYQVFLIFFIFFGSSFGYFFTLYHKKTLLGSSSSLTMQAGLSLVNPQFAYSLIFFILLLIVLLKKQKTIKDILLVGLLNFFIISLKFYGGVISLFLSLIYLFFENLKKISLNQLFQLIKIFFIVIVFSFISIIIFYQPFHNKNNTGIVFSPFSIAHSLIEERDLFYLPNIVNARYYLYSVNPFSPRLLAIEMFTVLLFVFFNLGTRFFGLVDFLFRLIKKKMKHSPSLRSGSQPKQGSRVRNPEPSRRIVGSGSWVNLFEITLFFGMIFSFSLSLLFIQKGIWWNTIQFSYYGLFLGNFFIANFLSQVLKRKNKLFAWAFVILIIIMTIPENYDIIRNFIPNPNASYIPKEELEALSFLRKQPEGVVFAPIINQNETSEGPKILGLIRDTAYVSAFSGKQTYLNDIHVLEITGIDYKQRKVKINQKNILKNIDYFYILKNSKKNYLINSFFFSESSTKIFENEKTEIWKRK